MSLPNENPTTAKLRAELLEAEIALRDQRERVAELRRQLPGDTPFEDVPLRVCELSDDRPARETTLSGLFDAPELPLVLLQFMFGKAQTAPCPMCTMWADGYDGVVRHLAERVNFAVAVAGDAEAFREYGRGRGWRNLRVVSTGDTMLKPTLGFETEEGGQMPGVSVFTLGAGGVQLFYSGGALLAPGEFRGMDLLSPVWNFLDLTPGGRGDFMPQLDYEIS